MIEDDWRVLMEALSIKALAVPFDSKLNQRGQDAVADHMIGVQEAIEAHAVPTFIKALSDSQELLRIENLKLRAANEVLLHESKDSVIEAEVKALNIKDDKTRKVVELLVAQRDRHRVVNREIREELRQSELQNSELRARLDILAKPSSTREDELRERLDSVNRLNSEMLELIRKIDAYFESPKIKLFEKDVILDIPYEIAAGVKSVLTTPQKRYEELPFAALVSVVRPQDPPRTAEAGS